MQLGCELVIWTLWCLTVQCTPQSIVFPTTPPLTTTTPAPYYEGLRECPQGSDTLLSECLKLSLEDIRPFLSGIPQIGFKSYDPLYLKEFLLPVTNKISYKWKNIETHGLSKYSQNEVFVNTKEKIITLWYVFPRLRFKASYERQGQFLRLPLRGAGKLNIDLLNYQLNGTLFLKVDEENGEPIIRIDDIAWEDSVDEIWSHIPNLARSGFWGELMDGFLSDKAKWIYEKLVGPMVHKEVAS